jgi:hypothetical protein
MYIWLNSLYYLLIFIMRPTKGWEERARTAPVTIVNSSIMLEVHPHITIIKCKRTVQIF